MAGELYIHRDGDLARLTLSNPAKKNALEPPMLDALVDAIAELPRDGVRAAVLTAEGTIFSSGYDLGAIAGAERPGRSLEKAVTAILEGSLPIVAALPGLAIGGGCDLACACDLRVGHPGVSLQMPPVRLGLVYSPAGLRRFVSLIGPAHARELFLTGERVPAETAMAWGMLDRVVPAHDVLSTATALAGAIARGAPSSVRAMRHLLAAIELPLPKDVLMVLEDIAKAAINAPDAVAVRAEAMLKKPRP